MKVAPAEDGGQRPAPASATTLEAAGLASKVLDLGRGQGAGQPGARAGGTAPARRRGWFWRGCWCLAWLSVLLLLAIAALRLAYHDGARLLIWLNAFTLYLYLPAYACFAWALWQRRWLLAAASGAMVGCHLAWVGPDFQAAAPLRNAMEGAAQASRPVRIFYANIGADNDYRADMLREVGQSEADVVVLVEYRRWWHQSVQASPVMAGYRHGMLGTLPFVGEFGIFSKLPIVHSEHVWTAGRLNFVIDVDVEGQPLRLFCIHAPRPMEIPGHDYESFWREISHQLAAQTQPIVVLGDLNATQHSRAYRELTAGGLRSAHVDRGRGYAVTWPNGQWPLPPIRIDHALLSAGVECLSIREGRGLGCDHKPLVLEVRLAPPAPGSRD